jgi:hypothetical protein
MSLVEAISPMSATGGGRPVAAKHAKRKTLERWLVVKFAGERAEQRKCLEHDWTGSSQR